MCMHSVSPRQQGDPKEECCDTRHLLLRNKAATSEIIPALYIGGTKLISNQLRVHIVYSLMYSLKKSQASSYTITGTINERID